MDIDPDNPLAAEIRHEMASAYFAACRKMVDALEALKAFDRDSPNRSFDAKAAKRAALLDEARERVYFVVIQREAMKLPTFGTFFEDYDVPEEVKTRLGPKSRKGS